MWEVQNLPSVDCEPPMKHKQMIIVISGNIRVLKHLMLTRKIWLSLKNADTIDIWSEFGAYQLETGSMLFHFLSSMKEMKDSLSRVPLYCLNSPFKTLKIISKYFQ